VFVGRAFYIEAFRLRKYVFIATLFGCRRTVQPLLSSITIGAPG